MDSSERRKVNRLLRKPNTNLSRLFTSPKQRPSQKYKQLRSSSSAQGGVNEDDSTQHHELSIDMVKFCSDMCGVANVSPAAALVLQKHLNQIARLLIHSILRVMEQSRRGVPQASDVDCAAVMVGLEAPFGTTPVNFLPVRTGGRTATSGPGGKVFFIRPDKEIDVKALLLREPAGVVYDVSLVAHWLSVNGKQPISPQNPSPEFLARMNALSGTVSGVRETSKTTAAATRSTESITTSGKLNRELTDTAEASGHPRVMSSIYVDRRPHEVSQEVMIYFRELTEACVGASENRRHEALENATLDPGLQSVLPHLVTFIAEGVRVNVTNHNLAILIYLMRLVKALVDNPHICLEPYLHLLVPTVTTCVLNRQLCAKPITDNHWALRDFAAKQLVTLCNRHNTSTNELYTRVTKELSRALNNWIDGSTDASDSTTNTSGGDLVPVSVDPDKPDHLTKRGPNLGTALHSMNTLYGILVTLAEFGAQSLRILVFPMLPALCQRLTNLVEPPTSEDAPFHTPAQRLSPADQRSFEFLKGLMTNRISLLLNDWRTRQNLGTSLDDYRSAYGCMASCLHRDNHPARTTDITSTVTVVSTPSARIKTEEAGTTRLLLDRPIQLVPISR